MQRLKKENVILVVACKEESNGLLEKLGSEIVYTGIGKVNAAYNLTKVLTERKMTNNLPKYVINVGSCGSKKFKKGSLVACNRFIQKDMDCVAFGYKLGQTPSDNLPYVIEHDKIIDNLQYAVCGSGDKFETEECEIQEIDVVEMEAYALAKVCKLENINFISVKYITDGLDDEGADNWNNNVLNCPESLYNYLNSILE